MRVGFQSSSNDNLQDKMGKQTAIVIMTISIALEAISSMLIVFLNLYSSTHSSDHSFAHTVREHQQQKTVLRREKDVERDSERMVTCR